MDGSRPVSFLDLPSAGETEKCVSSRSALWYLGVWTKNI